MEMRGKFKVVIVSVDGYVHDSVTMHDCLKSAVGRGRIINRSTIKRARGALKKEMERVFDSPKRVTDTKKVRLTTIVTVEAIKESELSSVDCDKKPIVTKMVCGIWSFDRFVPKFIPVRGDGEAIWYFRDFRRAHGIARVIYQCQDDGCRAYVAHDYIPGGIGGGEWHAQCPCTVDSNWIHRARVVKRIQRKRNRKQ